LSFAGSLARGFVAAATRLQGETGIPYLIFDGALEASPQVLRLIGAALGAAQRAEMLAAAADDVLALTRAPLRQQAGSFPAPTTPAAPTGSPRRPRERTPPTCCGCWAWSTSPTVTPPNCREVTQSNVLARQPDVVFQPNAEFIKAFAAPDWAELPAVKPAVCSPRRARLSAGSTSRHRSIGCSGCAGSAASSNAKAIPKISGRRRGILLPLLPGRAERGAARPAAGERPAD
jgi:hypothetical protein